MKAVFGEKKKSVVQHKLVKASWITGYFKVENTEILSHDVGN